jgi:Holliday junction resolvase RusA-like endonuclease
MNLTREQYADLIKRHPNLLGRLPHSKREQAQVQYPLGSSSPGSKTSANRMEKYHVVIISLRTRTIDDDNLVAGAKALRDAIAGYLGQDDADISWEYHQEVTKGQEGTIVKISTTHP